MGRIAKDRLRVSRDEFYDTVMAEVNAGGLTSINASIRRKVLGAASFSYLKDGALMGLDLAVLDTTQPGSIVDICRNKGGGGAEYEVTFSSQNSKKEIVTSFTLDPDPTPPPAPPGTQTGIPDNPYGTGRSPAPRYDPQTGIPIMPPPVATGQYYPHGTDPEVAMLRVAIEDQKRENQRLKEEHAAEQRRTDLALADEKHKAEMAETKAGFQKMIDELKIELKPKDDAGKPDREIEMAKLHQENARLQAEGQWKQIEAMMKASDTNFARITDAMRADREAATKLAEMRDESNKAMMEIRSQMSDPSRMTNSLDGIGKFAASMIGLQVQAMERLGDSQPQTMNPYVEALIKNGKELLQKLIPSQPQPGVPPRPPVMLPQPPINLTAMPTGVPPVGSLPMTPQHPPVTPPAPVTPTAPSASLGPDGLAPVRGAEAIIDAVMQNVIDNIAAHAAPDKLAGALFNHLDYLRVIGALPVQMQGIFKDPDKEFSRLAAFYELKVGTAVEAEYLAAITTEFKKIVEENAETLFAEEGNGEDKTEVVPEIPAGAVMDASEKKEVPNVAV